MSGRRTFIGAGRSGLSLDSSPAARARADAPCRCPSLTSILTATRSRLSLSTRVPVLPLVVLGLTTLGGALVGVAAALVAFVLENYYFVHPLHTFSVSRPNDVVSLVGFLVFAVAASLVVSRLARGRPGRPSDRARKRRSSAEAVANLGTTHQDLLPLLDSLRAVFDAEAVAILAARRRRVASGRRQWRRVPGRRARDALHHRRRLTSSPFWARPSTTRTANW